MLPFFPFLLYRSPHFRGEIIWASRLKWYHRHIPNTFSSQRWHNQRGTILHDRQLSSATIKPRIWRTIAVWATVSFDSPVIPFYYLLFSVSFSPSCYADFIIPFLVPIPFYCTHWMWGQGHGNCNHLGLRWGLRWQRIDNPFVNAEGSSILSLFVVALLLGGAVVQRRRLAMDFIFSMDCLLLLSSFILLDTVVGPWWRTSTCAAIPYLYLSRCTLGEKRLLFAHHLSFEHWVLSTVIVHREFPLFSGYWIHLSRYCLLHPDSRLHDSCRPMTCINQSMSQPTYTTTDPRSMKRQCCSDRPRSMDTQGQGRQDDWWAYEQAPTWRRAHQRAILQTPRTTSYYSSTREHEKQLPYWGRSESHNWDPDVDHQRSPR